ncbi:VC0807 family protein [Streptomyces bugieae]|uniref:VC0807 family protein n=1 Tax=Streptomyces bugieae TaxID=3098223 RepID=A0ABU7NSU8_9ACTN|nr:VC0807 family protein [Streptomyces sp. DSM 41528]
MSGKDVLRSFVPLIVDAGIPIASYYVLKDGFGLSTVAALGWSSVVPALRTVWDLVASRRVNGLALLILVVNVVGLAMTAVAGDARLMMAKDSAVSSTIGIVILLSVRTKRPLMTAGLKPFVTKGSAAGDAAWDRLLAESAAFRRAERRFSVIWGATLLTECVLKVIGAYTLPVETMVWLGTVMTVVAILVAMFLAGGSCADPMEKMVAAEVARTAEGDRPGDGSGPGAVAAGAEPVGAGG